MDLHRRGDDSDAASRHREKAQELVDAIERDGLLAGDQQMAQIRAYLEAN
jgi:hypothetical protein